MKLKTSFFSKTLIRNNFKIYGWFGIVYTLVWLMIMPLAYLQNSQRANSAYWYMDEVMSYDYFISNTILICIPILLAVFLFRYLHVEKSYTIIHSYPYTRVQIFNSYIVVGLVILVAPLLINTFIMIIINGVTGYSVDSIEDIQYIYWFLKTSLISITLFIISSFIGVVVGGSIWQLILSYIFCILPIGLNMMIIHFLNIIIYGFPQNYYYNMNYFCPLVIGDAYHDYRYNVANLIYVIVFYIFGLYLYKKRNLENSSNLICFNILKIIFKYGVTFCFMLLSGVALTYWTDDKESLVLFLVGCIIGAVIGYFLSEMLLQKQFNVFKKVKGLIVYSLIMTIIVIGFKNDVLGISTKIPDCEEVEKIEFYCGYGHNYFNNNQMYFRYKTDEMIEYIINLHTEIVDKRPNNGQSVRISYYLENGKNLSRVYNIDAKDYDFCFKPIFESIEYKQNHYGLLTRDEEDIYNININPSNVKEKIIIKDQQQVQELISITRQQITNETYEDMKESIDLAHMDFYGVNSDGENIELSAELRNNYAELISWLKDKGYYDDIAILPQDISKMAIPISESYNYESEEDIFNNKGKYNYLFIEDEQEIKQVLDSALNDSERYDDTQYKMVYMKLKVNDLYENIYVNISKLPNSIRQKLN
ncbi:hypothetical protein SH1V18_28380 [Vallitalea longa]|uniref:DUF6449 domain-containing protein n=1 Tax=Vallitalea longa TaxID=2936439 RepID=A0A9W5YFQ2_9FIRM|nr:DUF6449 domain-containing protein [Vallitalea longa]GKX30358.1 hypothetical protein SH1V18_28380 [Vallitalea longa]